MALVEKSLADHIGFLQLNRPEKHNRLISTLMRELIAALGKRQTDGSRAVILRGATFAMTPAKLGLSCQASGLIDSTSRSGVNRMVDNRTQTLKLRVNDSKDYTEGLWVLPKKRAPRFEGR